MIFAGIGSRKTPQHILDLMFWIGYLKAQKQEACATGACIGPDQAFANGTIYGGGVVHLYLPWYSYEQVWVNSLPRNQITITVLRDSDIEANNSVNQFHPTPEKLSQGMRKLHARNYLILNQINRPVICYTEGGRVQGGTGQGIRIAQHLGKIIHNLGDKNILDQYTHWVQTEYTALQKNGK